MIAMFNEKDHFTHYCCDLLLNPLNLDFCITHTPRMYLIYYIVNAHHYLVLLPFVVVDLFLCLAG